MPRPQPLAVMSAAISPSLSAKSSHHTYFRTPSEQVAHVTGPTLWSCEVSSGAPCVTCPSGMSPVIASATVRDRIHTSSSNIFGVGAFFLLQEHRLRVGKETTLFWEVARGPFDCEDVKNSEHSRPLSVTGERNDCIHMLLSFTCRPRDTHGDARLTWCDGRPVFLRFCSLIVRASLSLPALRAARVT